MAVHSFDNVRRKILFLSGLFGVLFLAVLGRLLFAHVVWHDKLLKYSETQYYKSFITRPYRGTIFDRNGHEMAVSVEVRSVFANPGEIVQKDRAARLLSKITGVDSRRLGKRFNSRKGFTWVKRKVSPSQVEAIKNLGLKGVYFTKENRRFYPGKELAARTVGFVGIDNQGLAGLESYFDEVIKGVPEKRRVERDALGQSIDTEESEQKFAGSDLRLTLDKVVQFISEKELKRKVVETGARGGIVIVMNPVNGELLSMAEYPQFNPNEYSRYHRSFWRNRAVSSVFEPGSTFKMFIAASALDSKVMGPEDKVFCENGSYKVGDIRVHEAHYGGYKDLSLKEVLQKSSNIGAIKVGAKMSRDVFYTYLKNFGIGIRTGINLPGESRGLFKPPERWSGSTQAAISFGQEVSVTPIQLVTAVSAIANGGLLLKPLIVKEILKNGKEVKSFKRTVVRRVISEESGKIMSDMLRNVVENGTGKKARIQGYRVAGKTGTAQKALTHGRGYSKTKFISSFAGFVSSDDVPILAMVVIIDEPRTATYGGQVAAPVFRSVASQTLRYLKVPSESNREYREARVSGTGLRNRGKKYDAY